MLVFVIVLVVLVALFTVTCIKIVPQAEAAVVERLGSYLTTWGNGLHVKVPFIDRVRGGITLKEQVVDFPPQPVITRDNVTMSRSTRWSFFQIVDPEAVLPTVWTMPLAAIENLTATTLRNMIGDLELDHDAHLAATSINAQHARGILDEATDAWGIKVNRVEAEEHHPARRPSSSAMEKQMKAEREKPRGRCLLAEGEKQAADHSSPKATSRRRSCRPRPRSRPTSWPPKPRRRSRCCEAEGEAEAIRNVQQATADGIRMVREAGADNAVLTLQAFEALKCAANGRATDSHHPVQHPGPGRPGRQPQGDRRGRRGGRGAPGQVGSSAAPAPAGAGAAKRHT